MRAFLETVTFMQENVGTLKLGDLKKLNRNERAMRERLDRRDAIVHAEERARLEE